MQYGAVTVPYPIDTLTSKINEAEKEMVSSEYINKSGYLGKANSNVLFFWFCEFLPLLVLWELPNDTDWSHDDSLHEYEKN